MSQMVASETSDWFAYGIDIRARRIETERGGALLTISVPEEPSPPEGWPILWVLDARMHGLTMMETARRLSRRGSVTKVRPWLVVGLAQDEDRSRAYSFTSGPPQDPAEAPPGPTGGAEDLAALLLGPARDAVLETGLAREGRDALWAHSMSGWFALWLTGRAPERFGSVAAISPSLWWDERPFAAPSPDGPAVFLAVGEREVDREGRRPRGMIGRIEDLADRLAAAGRPSAFQRFADEDHASMVTASAAAALRFASSVAD